MLKEGTTRTQQIKKWLLIAPNNKTLCPIFARHFGQASRIAHRLIREHYKTQPAGQYVLLRRGCTFNHRQPRYELNFLYVHPEHKEAHRLFPYEQTGRIRP